VDKVLATVIGFLIPAVEACGALVIAVSAARTIILYIIHCVRPGNIQVNSLRIRLGQSMVMGLEFQVAADILKTALSPEWNDILQLAALVALRTLLNYLLEYELRLLDQKTPKEV